MISEMVWMPENITFLRQTLNIGFVNRKLQKAVEILSNEPEYSQAKQVENDLPEREEIVQSRIEELPNLLLATNCEGWSV